MITPPPRFTKQQAAARQAQLTEHHFGEDGALPRRAGEVYDRVGPLLVGLYDRARREGDNKLCNEISFAVHELKGLVGRLRNDSRRWQIAQARLDAAEDGEARAGPRCKFCGCKNPEYKPRFRRNQRSGVRLCGLLGLDQLR